VKERPWRTSFAPDHRQRLGRDRCSAFTPCSICRQCAVSEPGYDSEKPAVATHRLVPQCGELPRRIEAAGAADGDVRDMMSQWIMGYLGPDDAAHEAMLA
jgi:hypothetical protein